MFFITCQNCPTPYDCTDRESCKEETNNNCNLELMAEKIWSQVYPERRKWNEIGTEARNEWIRFTKVAREVILCRE
jgi:hypothetical protein